ATWENKRGFGYLTADKLADKTVCFSADGGLGDPTRKDKNIRVDKDGNYTFTLRTFPGDDMYRTDAASYTEATKEMHNYSPYDQISWKRNGDPIDVVKVVTDYYIKGKDITDWKDFYGPDAMMENKEGVYKMSVYLKKGDQFMFTSLNTIAGTSAVGSLYIKYPNLDDASKELFKAVGENIEVKEAGLYSFVFDSATKKLSAKVDKTATVALRDYYLDGTFAGEWGDTMYGKTADRVVGDLGGRSFKFLEPCAYKLIETEAGSGIYTISNIVLAKDSQVIIQTYKAGSKEPGNWGAEGYNALGTYNYKYLFEGGDSFSAVDTGNQNIKVLKAGTYNITFNSYSKMFKIEKAILERDVYIKGTINGWNHNFDAANKFTLVAGSEVEYEMTKTFAVKDEFGLAVYVLGGTTGMGDFLAKGALGDAAGNVNAKFIDAAKGNLIASEAGSFRIVYNRETKKINIFAVV
ncbi:MAG: SusF/SusE family outer membrane protein, partial [Clostridia bacterium]